MYGQSPELHDHPFWVPACNSRLTHHVKSQRHLSCLRTKMPYPPKKHWMVNREMTLFRHLNTVAVWCRWSESNKMIHIHDQLMERASEWHAVADMASSIILMSHRSPTALASQSELNAIIDFRFLKPWRCTTYFVQRTAEIAILRSYNNVPLLDLQFFC
jgi:hypothetical protein